MDKETVAAIAELLQPINNRLDRIEESMQPINSRLDRIEESMQPINSRFEKIEELLQPINSRLDRIEGDLSEVKEDTRHTRVLLEATHKNIRILGDGQNANATKLQQLDRMEVTLNDIKSDTEVLKDVVGWHSEDIKKLKQA